RNLHHHRTHQSRDGRVDVAGRAKCRRRIRGIALRLHHGDRQDRPRRPDRASHQARGCARILFRHERRGGRKKLPRHQALQAPQALAFLRYKMTVPAFPDLTLPQMLREHAARTPDRTAVRQKDFGIWNPVSWQDYFTRASAVGHGYRAIGLGEGGHVAVLSENRVEWVLAQLGAGLVGAVTIGVYPTSPAPEVAYVLEHSDTEVIVCEDQEQVDKVMEVRAQ